MRRGTQDGVLFVAKCAVIMDSYRNTSPHGGGLIGCWWPRTKRPVLMPADSNPLFELETTTGSSWTSIRAAEAKAVDKRKDLLLKLSASKLVHSDTAFVLFGSLARNEVTAGSDLDWTLLVDGQCDTKHLDITKGIEALVREDNKPPGPTGLFGTMTFSHELVHRIGGEADSNRNTTRRILLLLESRGLIDDDPVRERVLRALLKRYLQEDLGYHQFHDWKQRVPRFLLNDIVRFWRTMAVDYADKRRDRGQGWALRNFKLRLSRKLTFTAGLAMCMSCQILPPKQLANAGEPDFYLELEDYLVDLSNKPPLQIVAEFVRRLADNASDAGNEQNGANANAAGRLIFQSYDRFLEIIDDPERRSRLEELTAETASSDPLYSETRRVGTNFQEGLSKLFFGTDEKLTAATQRYGVF